VVQAPPRLPEAEGEGDLLTTAVPMLGGLGSVAVVATIGSGGTGGQERSLLAGGIFLLATLAFVLAQLDRQRARRLRTVAASRTAYLRHLSGVRAAAREAAAGQRAALLWLHPHPDALPALAAERTRVWERRPADADFLQVRYGVGTRPLCPSLVPPEEHVDNADPVAVTALRRLLVVHRMHPDLPVTVDLRDSGRIELCGEEDETRAVARSLICSATTFHAPDHLAVAVLASDDTRALWDWVTWLPHALSGVEADAVGPRRLVSTDLSELARLLALDLDGRSPTGPHLLLVVDGGVAPCGLPGVTVLDLLRREGETEGTLRLVLDEGGGATASPSRQTAVPVRPDRCDPATAEALARRLLPLRPPGCARGSDGADGAVTDLLGLGDVRRLDPPTAWRPRPPPAQLRVPIGIGDDGEAVHLDLKESAQHGMGPHGLLVGATGSGKSELLRTLVLGLATTHSPEQLNLVLVDFKGGATFAGLSAMPHVSALITNLADELALVDRMYDALSGEMVRRQELLRDAGDLASIRDHERARAEGADLPPLPSLFVVVDEFAEMLTAKPELIDLFVAIGRLGRSLGLHLLLASQRLEEGRLRGLEAHLSYRIGLRTFSAQESRSVLGVPDAYELPARPGLGLLQPDRSTLVRFTAGYVSGPLPEPALHGVPDIGPVVLPWTTREVRPPEPGRHQAKPAPLRAGRAASPLSVAVARMRGSGPRARRIWLPPLDVPDTLGVLMPDLAPDPALGLVSRRWRSLGGLTLPVGVVDRPREQRRDPLTVRLDGAGGHVAVVGGPRAGKSTLLRTLVAALSLTSTPLESQIYVADLGGGSFAAMQRLPHVAGIGTRSEPDVVRRMVAEVAGIVDRRETHFSTHGIDSIETYRTRRADACVDDGYGDVFLVVDGWSTLRADFEDLEADLQRLAARALTYGVHLVTASSRWADYRAATRDLFGTRLELRLGDPADSEVDRRLAAAVPAARPGRGLVPGGLHFLTALPRIEGDPDAGSLGDGLDRLVTRVAEAWPGPAGPKLRLLPHRVAATELLDQVGGGPAGRLLLGVDEKALALVGLDPDTEPHWLVFGDGRSGKSAALRTYVHEVVRTRAPAEAQLVVVDYRRSLPGEVPDAHLLHYLTSATQAAPTLAELAQHLTRRLPGPDVTPVQLRRRSWWTGADVFVVVDDYDLVATGQGSPLHPLLPLLAQARDVGLHLALARRAGGASRALYEPLIQTLRDLASPGLLLSGSPDEGPLVGGVRPTAYPPGRGRLVTRDRGVDVVQLAWREPTL
jgi:S-DNA-T family DNA segregation ATPase FtsK/SpoIIIE